MSHSISDAVAIFAGVAILAAIGLLLVGMVVYSMPGRLWLGQQLMRLGAIIAMVMIFTCGAYGAIFLRREPTWRDIGLFLLGLLILFVKPLWKLFNQRRK